MSTFKDKIYSQDWNHTVVKEYDYANKVKPNSQDPSSEVESPFADTLAKRVSTLLEEDSIREIIEVVCKDSNDRIKIVVHLVDRLLEHYKSLDLELKIEKILKIVLSVLTEGIVTAPLDGLISVSLLQDNSLKMVFAGPIRAAGGTILGLIVLCGQYLRKLLNLNKYKATPEQIQRNIVQILAYLRKHPSQLKPSTEQISFIVSNCPIMIDGIETQKEQVPYYKYLPRIQKPRIRGAVSLVVVEGFIIRSLKIKKLAEQFQLELNWIDQLINIGKKYRKVGQRTISNEQESKFRLSIGRPMISSGEVPNGMRLRIGSTPTTGLSACNISPLLIDLVKMLNIGTQLVVNTPGKGATITGTCNDLAPPLVRYVDGVRYYQLGTSEKVLEIIDPGEILFGVGEFLEFQKKIPKRDYCLNSWRLDNNSKLTFEQITESLAMEILEANKGTRICPKYALNLENINHKQYQTIKNSFNRKQQSFSYDEGILTLLNKLGVCYTIQGLTSKKIVPLYKKVFELYFTDKIQSTELSFMKYQTENPNQFHDNSKSNLTTFLNHLFEEQGLPLAPEKGYFVVYSRVGRAQAVNLSRIKPNGCHSLAQYIQKKTSESFWTAVQKRPLKKLSYDLRLCKNCQKQNIYRRCLYCDGETEIYVYCDTCKQYIPEKDQVKLYEHRDHKLKPSVSVERNYLNQVNYLKGLISQENVFDKKNRLKLKKSVQSVHYPEPLCKGVLRSYYSLPVTKDGTVRISHPILITTHFVPSEVGITLKDLQMLGYTHDVNNELITSLNQIIPLKVHDVIVSKNVADVLLRLSKYIDSLLKYYYKVQEPYYGCLKMDDLKGVNIYSMSPHTSIAPVGRIIGFTTNLGVYYHPTVVASRRRDVDGDIDTCGLAMDCFLNMSRRYLKKTNVGAYMGVPITLNVNFDLKNVAKEILSKQVSYDYKDTPNYKSEHDPKKITTRVVQDFLKEDKQIQPIDYGYNTPGFKINTYSTANLYRDLESNTQKVDLVLQLQKKLTNVDQTDCIVGLLEGHLIPDLVGNLNAFFKQKLKCDSCQAEYLVEPLRQTCVRCGLGRIKSTVYPGMVVKYYPLLKKLTKIAKIPSYLVEKIQILDRSLEPFVTKVYEHNRNPLKDRFIF